jgi:hypothetical protein
MEIENECPSDDGRDKEESEERKSLCEEVKEEFNLHQFGNKAVKGYSRGRCWLLTYAHCDLEMYDALKILEKTIQKFYAVVFITKWIVCVEPHKDGSPHLHFAIRLSEKVCFDSKLFDLIDFSGRVYHGHYSTMRENWNAIYYYCVKGGKFITNTIVNSSNVKSKNYKKINELILKGDLHSLVADGTISISQFNSYSKAKLTYVSTDPSREKILKRRCYWIYGDPGVGKSYLVRQAFPGVYVKPIGKWWDGYNMERVVLMEDFDKNTCTLQELKIWADQYSDVNCEIKGGMCKPCYDVLIITSNYSIDYCFPWKEDSSANEAIERRFKSIKYEDRDQYDEIIKELTQSLDNV